MAEPYYLRKSKRDQNYSIYVCVCIAFAALLTGAGLVGLSFVSNTPQPKWRFVWDVYCNFTQPSDFISHLVKVNEKLVDAYDFGLEQPKAVDEYFAQLGTQVNTVNDTVGGLDDEINAIENQWLFRRNDFLRDFNASIMFAKLDQVVQKIDEIEKELDWWVTPIPYNRTYTWRLENCLLSQDDVELMNKQFGIEFLTGDECIPNGHPCNQSWSGDVEVETFMNVTETLKDLESLLLQREMYYDEFVAEFDKHAPVGLDTEIRGEILSHVLLDDGEPIPYNCYYKGNALVVEKLREATRLIRKWAMDESVKEYRLTLCFQEKFQSEIEMLMKSTGYWMDIQSGRFQLAVRQLKDQLEELYRRTNRLSSAGRWSFYYY